MKDKDYSADGNVSANGLTVSGIFNNYAGGDYTLKNGSPVLNRGNNSLYSGLDVATLDLSGNKRWISGRIDLGAYEHQTVVVTPDVNNIVYVNSNADGTGNGSSWVSAVTQFQAAVNGSAAGGQVWVAKGTYQPTSDSSFSMKEGVAIYGGFVGNETALSQRNYTINQTTLHGLADIVVRNDDNGLTATAILDGFTITKGDGSDSGQGGGMYNFNVSPSIRNCIFRDNLSFSGGGMLNRSASPLIINCLFTANLAMHQGGSIHNALNSAPVIINSTFTDNNGKGIYSDGNNDPQIYNSVIWEDVTGHYTAKNSLIKDKNDVSNGNIIANGLTANDIFTNYLAKDYTLKNGSPVVNKGSNVLYTGLDAATLDLAGKPRLFDGTIDLGAYENQTATPLPVSFGKFTASLQNNRVKLSWNTFSETNNEAFIVLRSTDGVNYSEITQQLSKGDGANDYIAYDHHPANGVNYYRLKQKDIDGAFTELGDDAVNVSLGGEGVKAWPNPVREKLNLSFAPGQYQSLRLMDTSGRKLQERTLTNVQTNAVLEMGTYPRGVYFVELKGDRGNHLIKVLK